MGFGLLILLFFAAVPVLIVAVVVWLTTWDKNVQVADATDPKRLSYLNRAVRITVSGLVLCYAHYGCQHGRIVLPGKRSYIELTGAAAQLGAWAVACFCAGALMPVLACYLPAKWHHALVNWPPFLFSTAAVLVLIWAVTLY